MSKGKTARCVTSWFLFHCAHHHTNFSVSSCSAFCACDLRMNDKYIRCSKTNWFCLAYCEKLCIIVQIFSQELHFWTEAKYRLNSALDNIKKVLFQNCFESAIKYFLILNFVTLFNIAKKKNWEIINYVKMPHSLQKRGIR